MSDNSNMTNDDWVKFLKDVKAECGSRGIDFPIEIIPCTDALSGETGYSVFAGFYDKDGKCNKEIAVAARTRFADPIKNFTYVGEKDVASMLDDCVSNGWKRYDDPIRRLVGFLNFETSECLYFKPEDIKNVGIAGLSDRVIKALKITF